MLATSYQPCDLYTHRYESIMITVVCYMHLLSLFHSKRLSQTSNRMKFKMLCVTDFRRDNPMFKYLWHNTNACLFIAVLGNSGHILHGLLPPIKPVPHSLHP